MPTIMRFTAAFGLSALAMLAAGTAHAATATELCREKLIAHGLASNTTVVAHQGYCYDKRSCPKMNKAFGLQDATSYFNETAEDHLAQMQNLLIDNSPAGIAASCNACTADGKPRCLKQ